MLSFAHSARNPCEPNSLTYLHIELEFGIPFNSLILQIFGGEFCVDFKKTEDK